MARSDQFIGLNKRARRLVQRKICVHEQGLRTFANGRTQRFNRWRRIPVARKEVIGVIAGAWIPVVAQLHRYTLPGGRVLEEFVQATPWSSGPCYFLALQDKKGRPVPESLWTEDEMGC